MYNPGVVDVLDRRRIPLARRAPPPRKLFLMYTLPLPLRLATDPSMARSDAPSVSDASPGDVALRSLLLLLGVVFVVFVVAAVVVDGEKVEGVLRLEVRLLLRRDDERRLGFVLLGRLRRGLGLGRGHLP